MKKSAVRSRTVRRSMPKKKAAGRRAVSIDAVITLDARREGLEPILGAAYLMIDRAYVHVGGDPQKKLIVTLRPKRTGTAAARAAVAKDFRAELAAQRVRWAIARGNQSVREYVAENALALAQEFAARVAAPEAAAPAEAPLTIDQRAEIERLIAEVEAEIKTMNEQKPSAEPKAAAAPWEAGRPNEGEKPA